MNRFAVVGEVHGHPVNLGVLVKVGQAHAHIGNGVDVGHQGRQHLVLQLVADLKGSGIGVDLHARALQGTRTINRDNVRLIDWGVDKRRVLRGLWRHHGVNLSASQVLDRVIKVLHRYRPFKALTSISMRCAKRPLIASTASRRRDSSAGRRKGLAAILRVPNSTKRQYQASCERFPRLP